MLSINLKGKIAFVAGVGDDQGYGWAIAKSLAEAGATVLIGVWAPMMKIFTLSLQNGKFDASRKLQDGSLLEFGKIYPLDATFDKMDDVSEETRQHKRYKDYPCFTISDVAEAVEKDFGPIDFLVHSLANGPEVQKPLLETSRSGYLAAISSSAFSFISLLAYFGPRMKKGGAALSLSFIAAERAVPGYGGGMSSAKAALESDTRTLAWEAGRKWGIRVNTISAGGFRSRAAKAIGFIDKMITYAEQNAPLPKELCGEEVGNSAAFLLSPLASAITGTILYVDNGLHAMAIAVESRAFEEKSSAE